MVRDVAGGKPRATASRWHWKVAAAMYGLLAVSQRGSSQVVSAPVIAPPAPGLTAGAQTVTKVPSSVALTITTPASVFYGQPIDGLAQVTAPDGSSVSGTVTFFDGTVSMGSSTLDINGLAMLSVLMLSPGGRAITAAYTGNANSAGSTSAVLHETVQQAPSQPPPHFPQAPTRQSPATTSRLPRP
jgi:hypothetical protein